MSIKTTLCHPEAESLVSVETADAYLEHHPDCALWRNLGGGTEEARIALAEKHLICASRMICRAPLAFGPLANKFAWAPQGLRLPTVGHQVIFGVIDECGEKTFSDASLKDMPRARFPGGSVRFSSGEIIDVTDFAASTGTVTFETKPSGEFHRGTSFALIEALPLPVVHAVCEQAVYLAGGPNFSSLNRAEQGIRKSIATGIGGGTVENIAASMAGELCFAARRLLAEAGLLRSGRNLSSGRA